VLKLLLLELGLVSVYSKTLSVFINALDYFDRTGLKERKQMTTYKAAEQTTAEPSSAGSELATWLTWLYCSEPMRSFNRCAKLQSQKRHLG
jgi:hypothetical protein